MLLPTLLWFYFRICHDLRFGLMTELMLALDHMPPYRDALAPEGYALRVLRAVESAVAVLVVAQDGQADVR